MKDTKKHAKNKKNQKNFASFGDFMGTETYGFSACFCIFLGLRADCALIKNTF